MDALLLLLLDSRAPAGGHSHSGGMEPAITAGVVRDLAGVEDFCRGRLRTAGRVAADAAGLACAVALAPDGVDSQWDELDAELDARMPSEAARAASRQLGRGLLRLVRAMLPDPDARPTGQLGEGEGRGGDRASGERWGGGRWGAAPHHPIVLGAAVAAADGTPQLAARAAALATVSAPASAAVRLLGLDPFAVQAMLARLANEIDERPWTLPADPTQLAADCAPVLDLLADIHLTTEVRLFAS